MLKKGDMILLVFVLIAVAAGFWGIKLYNSADKGTRRIAVIKQDNKVIRKIDIDKVKKPEYINVSGRYDDVILIENGRIRFQDADCPDKICVKTGWLTQKGDMAVCLPNHTTVKIEGQADNVDGVAY